MRHVFGCAVVALGRGMETNRRQIEIKQMQILDDKGIDTDSVEVMYHRYRLRILIVMEQGVDCHQHLYPVGVGIAHDLRQIFDAVSGRLPRTESRRTDIDSVCSGLDSRFRYFDVFCRSEQAKRYITMPAVTDTFIECFVPYWGISIH